jgi:hypothetical protein
VLEAELNPALVEERKRACALRQIKKCRACVNHTLKTAAGCLLRRFSSLVFEPIVARVDLRECAVGVGASESRWKNKSKDTRRLVHRPCIYIKVSCVPAAREFAGEGEGAFVAKVIAGYVQAPCAYGISRLR